MTVGSSKNGGGSSLFMILLMRWTDDWEVRGDCGHGHEGGGGGVVRGEEKDCLVEIGSPISPKTARGRLWVLPGFLHETGKTLRITHPKRVTNWMR